MKKHKALKRERVNRALESMFDYPLTVVEAPIGYGKTTAVREFLASKGCPVLWLTFLTSEDTAVYFWDRFSTEIGKVDRKTGESLKSLGFPTDAPQTANILSILKGLYFEPDTILVIDDYHFVKDLRIGRLLSHIAAEQPENLYITVITRDTSNLELEELLAKGQCNILPQQTLRFTDEEVRSYCALMGFSLPESELQKICEYAEGWISLIYLIMLGAERGIPIGLSRALDSLVEKVLYNAYDGQIRQFLLKLSVMDSFTAEQALFVTGEEEAEDLLKKLRRENAFIAFEETSGTYKMHNVLLDFLRSRFTDTEEFSECCRRLGEWHLAKKDYPKAYGYLYRAGETERILALLDNEDILSFDINDFGSILELFTEQPRELLFKYPIAYTQYICLAVLSGDRSLIRVGEECLNQLQEIYGKAEGIPAARKNLILGRISIIRVFTVWNDSYRMMEYVKEAVRLLEGYGRCVIKENAEFTFGSPHLLYSYYTQPDKLKEMADHMMAVFPDLQLLTGGCGEGSDHLIPAEYALETGDWKAAELNALKAVYKANAKKQTCIVLCADFALMRLYIYQGRISEALELLGRLRDEVTKENHAVNNTTLEIIEGYVNACLGRAEDIPAWLRTGDMSPARFIYQGHAFNYIVYGKAVLLSKNYIKLEMLTEEFKQYFSTFHYQLGFLHKQILEAAAKYRLYGLDAGCSLLRRAFDEAREDHIILPFAEYAPDIIDLVRQLVASSPGDEYIKKVLLSCEKYMDSLKNIPENSASLSARELQVLALAAEGLKRGEIAQRLHIMPGTVKVHMEHVYRKLEAGGKLDAVNKARKLKLI